MHVARFRPALTLTICGALAVIAQAGCAGAEADTVRAQAAKNFACPTSNVAALKLRELDSETTTYQVEGCGRSDIYTCKTTVEPIGGFGRGHNSQELTTRCRASR